MNRLQAVFTAWVAGLILCSLAGCAPPQSHSVEGPPLGTMTASLSPVMVPDSTADTYSTLEGFSGAVAIIEARWPLDKAVCVGTLVNRDKILTAPECTEHLNNPHPLRIVFPQAEGTPDHTFDGISAWNYHDELAVVTLDREVPSAVVKRPAPMYFLGGGEDGNLDRSLMATVGFQSSGPNPGRFYSEMGPLLTRFYTAPFRLDTGISNHPGDRLKGAPLILRDTRTGDFTIYGVYNEYSKFVNGPYRLRWASTWNANIPGDTTGRWQHQDALEAQVGMDRNRDGYPDGLEACDAPGHCQPCMFAGPLPVSVDLAWQNSNQHVEEALGVGEERDYCDPIPVMRLEREASVRYGPKSQSSHGEMPASAVHFEALPRIGFGALQYQFHEDIAFRFCSCYDNWGWIVDEEICYTADETCDASEAEMWHEPSTKWRYVDVSLKDRENRIEVDGETGGATRTFTRWELDARKSYFVWNWYGSAVRGEIIGKNVSGTPYWEAEGFLASFVVPEGPQRSQKDDATRQKLRVSLQYYSFPDFIDWTGIFEPFEPDPAIFTYVGPHQVLDADRFLWIAPKSWSKPVTGVPSLPVPMLTLANDVDELRVTIGSAAAIDVAPFLSPQVRSIAGADRDHWAKFTAVEPLHLLEKENRTARFVALARSGSPKLGIAVGERASSAQGLKLRGEGWEGHFGGMGIQGIGLQSFEGFQLGQGAKAVFSAWEDAVYVVEGDMPINRYDLSSGIITPYNPGVKESVLGATYDPATQTIYYIDVDGQNARLVSYELDSIEADVLWEIPFIGKYSFYSLDLSSERELLLTAGTDTEYTVWRIDPSDGLFGKRLDGLGGAVAAPAMGMSNHVIPVLHADGHLEHHRYERWQFEEGDPCTAL